jgi:riboflavin kinase/FMN adenylyltransferase
MFDGLHLGHREVIAGALAAAREDGGVAAVLTFDPHPSAVLRPDQATPLLHPAWWRRLRLAETGVAEVVVHPFDTAFASLTAEEFPAWLKQQVPSLRSVHVGENWRFGRGRIGDVVRLVQLAAPLGILVRSTPRVTFGDEPISSTRLRGLIAEGRMEEAAVLLGSAYDCGGTVEAGRRLGRVLGFPTLNLPWDPGLRPRFGVYAVQVAAGLDGAGPWLPGVANYGVRPTVEAAGRPLVEVHVLDHVPALDAGSALRVRWLGFLRPERKFDGVDALRVQIAADADAARAYFAGGVDRR